MVVLKSDAQVKLFLRTIDARPVSFFALHVKALFFAGLTKNYPATRIISVCSSVEDIGYYPPIMHHHDLPIRTGSRRLKRFSGHIAALLDIGRVTMADDIPRQLFADITHLEFVEVDLLTHLRPEHLPSLTHLACTFANSGMTRDFVRRILAHRPSLQVCAMMLPNFTGLAEQSCLDVAAACRNACHVADPRFIVMVLPMRTALETWERCVRGDPNCLWALVERKVQRQREKNASFSAVTGRR